VALQIINAGPPPEEIADKIKAAIAEDLPDAEIAVEARGPGHFEIRVVDRAFEGLNRVKQQQLVYKSITPLMAGKDAPVHAVDRLECVVPD